MENLMLNDQDVHLWLAFPKEIDNPQLLAQYHAMLTPEEAKQQQRFHFQRHRHQYLITRALIRSLLSRYVPTIAPADWRFEKNEYGRPHIAAQFGLEWLRFNLSHTDGLIACAVVRDREVGVDVENIQRDGELVKLADRYFSPAEVAELQGLADAEKPLRFFDYWTLKESYIKARGMGLSIPLDHFSFRIGHHTDLALDVVAEQRDPADRWQFQQWLLSPNYKMALAVERHPERRYQVGMRRTVPLLSEASLPCQYLRGNFD